MAHKALQKFGVSFRDMLKEVLTLDKNTAAIAGTLEPLPFDIFWRTLSIIEHAVPTEYHIHQHKANNLETKAIQQAYAELQNFLVSVLAQIATSIKKKTGGIEEIQPLINTSTFLVLSYKLGDGGNQPLWDAVKNLQKQHQSQGRPFPAVEEATKLITKVLENGLHTDALVRIASTILLSPEEIKVTENYLDYPALDVNNVSGGESMKIWSRLKELVTIVDKVQTLNDNIAQAISSILQNMTVLAKTFKISPELSSTQLLALVHMLSVFLETWTKADVTLLARAYATVENFFTWPRPSCDAAVDILKMMKNEIRSRGYLLMGKFLHESRIPQMKFCPAVGEEFWAQPIFCFMDSQSLESAKHYRLIKMQYLEESKSSSESISLVRGMSTYTQLHLILQLLSTNLPDVPQEHIIHVLMRLDQSKLTDVFYTACVASYEGLTVELPDKDAAVYVSRRMYELWNVMQTMIFDTPTFDIGAQSLLYPPTLPSIMGVSVLNSLESSGYNTRMALIGQPSQFPSTTYGAALEKLIKQHGLVRDAKDPAILRVFVCGSDRLMHSVMCGYLSICNTNSEILQGLEIKWYVVPLEAENSLSAFIARHDAWYHRYVFQPFRLKNPVIPWMRLDNPSFQHEEAGTGGISAPVGAGEFYKQLMENYARESKHSIEIVIHEILGFMDDSPTAQLAIPFMTRVEVSLRSMAMGKKKYEGDSRSVEEIIAKDRSFKPPNVILSYVKAAITVDLRVISREDPLETILIANIPVAKDKCFPSDPTKEGVELYARYVEAKKSKTCPPEVKCSVANLEITSINKVEKFFVLVDGEPYGPFQRVVLLMDEAAKKKLKQGNAGISVNIETGAEDLPEGHSTSVIPIQTYFPISL